MIVRGDLVAWALFALSILVLFASAVVGRLT